MHDPRTLRRWHIAIIVAFGLGGITLATWGARLPALQTELHASTAVLGVVLAGITVGSICGLLASTPVHAALGGRWTVFLALALVGVAMWAAAATVGFRSVPGLGVSFVAVGFGVGLLDVTVNVEGAAIEHELGKTALPLMHAAWSAGAAVGSAIGAACAGLGIAPSDQFAGEGVLVVVCAVFIAAWIPVGNRSTTEQPVERLSRRDRFVGWLRGWADVRLLMIGLVMLGVELGEGSANNWLTLAGKTDHGLSAVTAAAFFTVFAVVEMLTRIAAGPIVDRFGRVGTVRVTTAVGVVGALLFILGQAPWVVLVGVVLWAIGVSMGFPLGMSAAAESGPNRAARVSVVASIGYVANLAGPPALGVLAGSVGLLGALWAIVVLFVAAFLAAPSLRVPAAVNAAEAPA
jgi:MFS family permease